MRRTCLAIRDGRAAHHSAPEAFRVTVRGTAMLGLLATALASFTWLGEGPIVPRPAAPVPEEPPLLAAQASQVARLEWTRGTERLTVVRTPAGWVDAAGQRWPSDVVDVAVDALTSLHPRIVTRAEGAGLAEYGLAPAGEHLRVLDDTGHELIALDIGNRNPAWTGVYARRPGDADVLLVGSLLRWELDRLRSARESTPTP
jgi:hypothetical protein